MIQYIINKGRIVIAVQILRIGDDMTDYHDTPNGQIALQEIELSIVAMIQRASNAEALQWLGELIARTIIASNYKAIAEAFDAKATEVELTGLDMHAIMAEREKLGRQSLSPRVALRLSTGDWLQRRLAYQAQRGLEHLGQKPLRA